MDLPGLVSIFGDALYQDFGSIVRELTQNAHDAIVEECSSSPDVLNALLQHRVDIRFDDLSGLLIVADDGQGMSREQIEGNLNNFARSTKRRTQARLAEQKIPGTESILQIVGEYHVGFLSAMAVSSQLDVWSRPSSSDTLAVHWSYRASDTHARIQTIDPRDFQKVLAKHHLRGRNSGTVIVAKLSQRVLDEYGPSEAYVRDATVRYTMLLPVPIFFNGEQISCRKNAWIDPSCATEDEWRATITQMREESPVLVIPVYSPPSRLDVTGVLWIQERTTYFTRPTVDVYVKRMYVCTDDEIVVPDWARFISGMINSNKIRRIVAGNTIKNDVQAKKLREFLKDLIIAEFGRLRRKPESEYWQIVAPHDDAIKGSATDSAEFREAVWEKLRFPSRNRKFTIPEYQSLLKRKGLEDSVIYFYDKAHHEFSANLVSDATGIPVLALDQTRDMAIVLKIAESNKIELQNYRVLASEHFKAPPNSGIAFDSLVKACEISNIAAEVRAFDPDYLPAVLIEDKDLQEKRNQLLDGLAKFGEQHFSRDLERFMKRSHAANFGISFYLNTENRLIRYLATAPFDVQVAICLALYNISFMAIVPDIQEKELRAIYNSLTAVMMSLVDSEKRMVKVSTSDPMGAEGNESSVTEISESQSNSTKQHRGQRNTMAVDKDGVIQVFMITPFADAYRKLERVVRNIFERPPYFFRVQLARDYTHNSTILKNIRSHIELADAFVAEISDLNPNVMLELGAAIFALDNSRPVFSLRSGVARGDVPADIRSELYLQYGSLDDEPADIEGRIREQIERDGRPSHAGITQLLSSRKKRALTSTLMRGLKVQLQDSEIEAFLSAYQTVEDLIAHSETEIRQATMINEDDVHLVKHALEMLSRRK